MKRALSALTLLVLASLACMEQIATPTPTPVPSPTAPPATPTASPVPTAEASATSTDVRDTLTIQAVVYIRSEPDAGSAEIGSLTTGERVILLDECEPEWCNVSVVIDGETVEGWVFRGCTSDPAENRCEARP